MHQLWGLALAIRARFPGAMANLVFYEPNPSHNLPALLSAFGIRQLHCNVWNSHPNLHTVTKQGPPNLSGEFVGEALDKWKHDMRALRTSGGNIQVAKVRSADIRHSRPPPLPPEPSILPLTNLSSNGLAHWHTGITGIHTYSVQASSYLD
ncbi:uncharacterized protein BO97DRAFT_418284 [Aspergillus homomorphus CBS 101889]|uniref:Uncharacterized protein n=1 Tax=Aspergillus homomorphus (strain CBS 101889) TaxID=1450537 RepID=A0A395HIJ4_ASPHC|nr:hypothetical protein BO97DRAFT_418284 [Aspergillus homomorphus CBS 101889]RAL07732.1 hypothetical protein BO97DRAFT_418284 [Aspergillus homomorphus CBS 101889]